MKANKIGYHYLHIYGATYHISTVQLPLYESLFETLVYDPKTGDELDCIRAKDIETAKRNHVLTCRKWNDIAYNGSIDKQLHFANIGQFLKPIVCPNVIVPHEEG